MSQYPNNRNGIPWWLVIVAFVFMWPAGVVLLIAKLSQENGGSARRGDSYDRFAQEVHRGAQEFRQAASDAAQTAREAAQRMRDSAQAAQSRQSSRPQTAGESGAAKRTKYSAPQKDVGGDSATQAGKATRNWGKVKNGFVFRLVGGILAASCAFSTLMVLADGLASGMGFGSVALEALPVFICTGVGAGLFTFGQFQKSRSKRFKRYLNLIGNQDRVSISDLAAAFPARRSAVIAALEDMIEDGILGERAWIDYQHDELVMDGTGVGERRARTATETEAEEEHALLRQIRQVNAAIADPEMTRKIDRIAEITERILEFQQEHPEKAGELRKFLNYYLPTTLKILSTYAQLERQGIEGENIAATKKRIEGMMDMVVEGFERQLDKLFAGDMMDIAADITVMERMMQGDGLFGQDDITGGAGMGGH